MTIDSYNNMKKYLRHTISYSSFLKLKELAKNTVGFFDPIHLTILEIALLMHSILENQINDIEDLIRKEVLELNPKMLQIKYLSIFFIAIIIAEYNYFNGFASSSKCLAFAGLEPGRHQSGKVDINLPMVKHVLDISEML